MPPILYLGGYMSKQIQELLIDVKYKGIKPATTQLENLSEVINDASLYADDLNASLGKLKVPKSITNLNSSLDDMAQTFKHVDDNTQRMSETLEAVLDQLGVNADAARQDVVQLSETMEDLNSNTLAASKGVDKFGNEVKGTTASTSKMNNSLKDVNRQGTNTVRQFSKMARSAGGLTIAYAVIAANVFALSEAFRVLSDAANVGRLEEVSSVISASIGVSIQGTAQALLDATENAVSYQQALKLAAASTAYGFDTETIEKFAVVARRAAVVLGVDMTDALNRVIRGVSKAEVELLDELGITVRLNEAFADYAAQHNLAASSLNSFQRQQALANAVIRTSEQNLGGVDSALRSTPWEQFGANISSTTNEFLRFISEGEGVTRFLDNINEKFATMNEERRASSTTTAGISTFEKSADNISAISAFNNLLSEQAALIEEVAKAEADAQALRDKGYSTDFKLFKDDQYEIVYIDRLKTLEARVKGAKNELELTSDVLGNFSVKTRMSSEALSSLADDARNLTLLSRTLGGDLTTMQNDIRPDANPLASMISSIKSAEASVSRLISSGLVPLDSALKKLNISAEQFAQFSDIKEYAALWDTQRTAMLDYTKLQNASNATATANLSILMKSLQQMDEKNSAANTLLGVETLSVDQAEARYALMLKIQSASETEVAYLKQREQAAAAVATHTLTNLAAAKKSYSIEVAALSALRARKATISAIEAAEASVALSKEGVRAAAESTLLTERATLAVVDDFANRDLEATDQAKARLFYAQQTLQLLIAQGDAISESARKSAEIAVQGAQRDVQTEQDTASQSLKDTGVGVMATELAELSPEMANIREQVMAASDAWKTYGQSAKTANDLATASAMTMSSSLSSIGSVISAAAGAATSAIDVQIAMVEKQGGTEEEQAAKVKELNKKKIKEQEKQAKASILISTAQAAMLALATSGNIYVGLAQAALVTAAGALAYEQASNSATAQLAGLESSVTDSSASLTLGDTDTPSVDVSQAATASERASSLGDSGIYGRASAGKAFSGRSYLAGETGPEMITPLVDSAVTSSSDTAKAKEATSSARHYNFNISALDASSIIDRAGDILEAIEEEANQRGSSVLTS